MNQRTIGPVNAHLISGLRFEISLPGFFQTFTFHTFLSLINCLLLPTFSHRLQWFLKNPLFSIFSYRQALVTKFDLAVKKVKVNPGSSFEQTMIGWSSQCNIPSLVEIGPPVPEKKIFEGFLPYMGVAAILVMWPASCLLIFISSYLKAYIQNLVKNGRVVFKKTNFNFHM